MKLHLSGRLFLATATAGGLALLVAALVIAMGGRSVVAGPDAAPPAAAPTPVGHAWTELEGHGLDLGPALAAYLNTAPGMAAEFRLNGNRAVRLEPNATSPNVILGHSENNVTTGAHGAAICGGGESGNANRVTDDYGTVAGGRNNQAGDAGGTTSDHMYATVGGGYANTARGSATIGGGSSNTATGWGATIGGGTSNTAGGGSATIAGGFTNTASGGESTVGGGEHNTASASSATVGGGLNNTASASWATVPGGVNNTAAGIVSFAAGNRAKANNQGCFVWGDTTNADVACNSDNGFVVRASGNIWFGTTSAPDLATGFINTSTGAYLSSGGTWTNSSDRNLKDNFTPVDGQEVLARLADIPVTSWNYSTQDASIRHMGPVGQDFYAAFGLGDSDTGISTVDADGVALAAIQGLYQLSQEQAARIAAQQERINALEQAQGANDAAAGPFSGLTGGWLALGGLFVMGLVLAQRRLAGGRR